MTGQTDTTIPASLWPAARIEICGPLGSGKTTLLSLLACHGCMAVFEPVERHPYLADFYTQPARYALEKCGFFALDYLHSVKTHAGLGRTVVFDTGVPVLRSYHAVASLVPGERQLVDGLLDGIAQTLPPADLYVHLQATPAQLLARIARRGRPMETAISPDYVEAITAEIDQQMQQVARQHPVLELSLTELDGRTDPASIRPVVEEIRRALLTAQSGSANLRASTLSAA